MTRYYSGDEDEYGRKRSSSINKKITRLGSGQEEGVLYTVKVAVSIYMCIMCYFQLKSYFGGFYFRVHVCLAT